MKQWLPRRNAPPPAARNPNGNGDCGSVADPTARYVGGVSAAAALAAASALLLHAPSAHALPLALALGALMLVANLLPTHVGPKVNMTWDAAVICATALLLPAALALPAVGLGMGLAQLARRAPGDQLAFNAAQALLQAAAARALWAAGGWHSAPFHHPLQLALLPGVAGAIVLSNTLLISGVVALQLGARFLPTWRAALLTLPWHDLAQLALGALAGLACLAGAYWLLAPAAAAAVLLQLALARAAVPSVALSGRPPAAR